MKKLILFFAVAFMAVIFMSSCNKKDDAVVVPEKQYVSSVVGSFVAQEGDITLKSADLNKVTRTWSMYTNNVAQGYPANVWTLVDGREFINGSAAYNFWHNTANNPVSFNVSQDGQVYSNLTPDEDLRCILETKNSGNEVVYLGIVDFNPSAASFPMTVNGFRLGDKLTINADQLLNLPGGNRISITATFNLAPVDLAATKIGAITGISTQPSGKAFSWSDVHYGTPVSQVVSVGAGTVELYDGFTSKVTGTITITVVDSGSSLTGPTGGYSVNLTLPADPGMGHALTLTTNKIGWYDGDFVHFTDTDITVNAIPVPVN